MWTQSLRAAYRSLRSAPGFALTAILSLGIGIGGSVAIFTLVNSIVLKPLAYAEGGKLVLVANLTPHLPAVPLHGLLPMQFIRWRNGTRSLESIAVASRAQTLNLTGSGEPETLGVMRITAGFFDTLRIQPQRGRWFTESDEVRGMPNVAVLSDSLWRRRFSTDPNILGKKIVLNDAPYEVIGITPPDLRLFRGRQLHSMLEMPERTDLFLPLRFSAQEEQGLFNPGLVGIARLKPGVTPDGVRAELDSTGLRPIGQGLLMEWARDPGEGMPGWHVGVRELQTALVGDVRKGLLLLLFSVALVLLIACANVANLSLVRNTQRYRELAIRAALGASRGNLIRHSLMESFLVALGGTIVGLFLSLWIIDILVSRAPVQVPRLEETAMDGSVFAFAVSIGALTTILCGLLPAWRTSHVDPQRALSASGRGNTDPLQGSRFRATLVGMEVALSAVLVIGSGLLLKTFHHVINAPRGFDGSDLLALDFVLPVPRYQAVEKQASFFRDIHDGLSSIPGVVDVAANSRLPLTFEQLDAAVPEHRALSFDHAPPLVTWPSVSAEYFAAMKIPLRAGRAFREQGEKEPVVVISESAGRILWPGEDPLGKRVRRITDKSDEFSRVVGVAGDVLSAGLDRVSTPAVYRPFAQRGAGRTFSVVVRTAIRPDALSAAVRDTVKRVDPDIPIPEIRTMPAVIAKSVQQRRFQASLLSAFAFVAVLLAAIGVYGVVAFSFLQRRKEIGLRIALGAGQNDVSRLVLRNGMIPVFLGLAAGLLAAAFLGKWIASLLFQVRTLDPLTFVAASVILTIAAAIPCYLTARQAAGIDPMIALRLD